jgi:hypothetical protein
MLVGTAKPVLAPYAAPLLLKQGKCLRCETGANPRNTIITNCHRDGMSLLVMVGMEHQASIDIDCCEATSFGNGSHLQMQRSSLKAACRPSGAVIT